MASRHIAIRGDLEGFALYFEEPDASEPGEFIDVFPTLASASTAKRMALDAAEKVWDL